MPLREWSRRHASPQHQGNAVDDLVAGIPLEEVRRRQGLPAAAAHGVRTFYDQLDPGVRVCDGTACHFAGGPALAREAGGKPVRCLGVCYDPPGMRVGDDVTGGSDLAPRGAWGRGADFPRAHAPPRRSLVPPVVLRNLLGSRGASADEYRMPDGDTILRVVEASGLRGRGGAAYPTGAKWRVARDTPADLRYVVANGDEGDPGSYVDRVLMEQDPHAILAGMLACARAVGATRGVVFVRGEYPRARATMVEAAAEARDAGWLDPGFEVEVHTGAGSYVCGEETALLRAIEGLRGEPSPKPPYPAQVGLFGKPTVIQNVETLAQIPWLLQQGRRSDTKVASLAGPVAERGLVEFALGTPLSAVLGAAPRGARWKMALVGGPLGRVLPARAFDQPLSYDALPGLGHAGIVVFDETVSAGALARHLYDFAAAESCGTCTPCRVGTARLARAPDRAALERLCETLEIGSLCGFGLGVPRPIRDLLAAFGDEVFA
ncbi:MAG: NADH-ubiquinone oxidoreductase-F iron-sulfur binding region domain-containing protein [Pseudomonadota bacterium]|nr:NADH-ubiquinone oxidoreductase-F iron-sulfur binding region domain-containing protein [Pseudomonadota bacterium]